MARRMKEGTYCLLGLAGPRVHGFNERLFTPVLPLVLLTRVLQKLLRQRLQEPVVFIVR